MEEVASVGLIVVVAAVAAVVGVALGIFLIAPRIAGALDRSEAEDEEPGDRPA